MNVIDLFSGCGGLSRGFIDAGCKVILGIDNDQAALNTFEKNHDGAIGLNANLAEESTFDKVQKIIGNKSVDLIVGGPPCQGFSLTGPRNFDDPRNSLYLSFIKMVAIYHPKGFIIENVPGMATLYKGEVKNEIFRRFDALGYNIDAKVLCAADYAVPQIRNRLVFIGIQKRYGQVSFPEPVLTPDSYITSKEAISDLPALTDDIGAEVSAYSSAPETQFQKDMRKGGSVLYNHVATVHTDLVKNTIALDRVVNS